MEYNIDNIDLERFLTNSDIPQGFANFLMGTIIVFSVIVVICAVLILVAQIKMFKKGNQPGWAAIVPFYNQYVQCKMVGVNPWWILIVIGASFLGGIPVIGSLLTMAVSLYFTILLGVSTARAFGKDDAFAIDVEKRGFHPIQQYILSTEWDHINRVDTLLIDYFGCDDNAYTRAAIRKTLCAAVTRVFYPGTKFDMVLVLVGEQGTYKSSFVRKLGMEWFSDTFSTFQGKESFEQLRGAWLIEMAELSGLKKAEVETIKQFISKCDDMYRPAYGRTVETYKRQCVFFGTTNDSDFLHDPSGNRRFNPINVDFKHATKSVKDDLTQDEVDQIWAEAYYLVKQGEKLYFDDEESELAKKSQTEHSAVDERTGLVEQYLNRLLPKDWDKKDLYDRRSWLDDPLAEVGTEQRDFVCTAEIWCECLGKDKNDMTRYNTKDINSLMASLPNWEFISSTKNFPIYGKQRYYKRKDSLL